MSNSANHSSYRDMHRDTTQLTTTSVPAGPRGQSPRHTHPALQSPQCGCFRQTPMRGDLGVEAHRGQHEDVGIGLLCTVRTCLTRPASEESPSPSTCCGTFRRSRSRISLISHAQVDVRGAINYAPGAMSSCHVPIGHSVQPHRCTHLHLC